MFHFLAISKIKQIKKPRLFFIGVAFIFAFLIGFNYLHQLKGAKNWQFVSQSEISTNAAFKDLLHPFVFDQTKVYFGNLDGYVYALDKKTGQEKWRFRSDDCSRHEIAIASDLVYVADFDGRIYALDKNNGEEKWRFVTPDLINPDTSPVVSGDLVYFGSRNGIFYALDKNTGEKKWELRTKGIDNTRLVPGEVIIHFGLFVLDDKNVYINSSTDNAIYALDKISGEKRWQFKIHQFVFERPTVAEEIVIFRGGDGFLYSVDKETGQLKWQRQVGELHKEKILAEDNTIYYKSGYQSGEGNLYVLEAQTGEENWSYQSLEYVEKEFILAKDEVYLKLLIPGDGGRLVVLDKKTGQEKWQFSSNGLIEFGPEIENEIVLVAGAGDLYALARETGKEQWRFMTSGIIKYLSLVNDGVYLVSNDEVDNSYIFFLDKNTGEKKWQFKTTEVEPISFNQEKGELYFLSQDYKNLFKLRSENKAGALKLEEIDKINADDLKGKFFRLDRLLNLFKKNRIKIRAKKDEIETFGIYELEINHYQVDYNNVWEEVEVLAVFKDKEGSKYSLKGFYYDKDTWKVRFSPPVSGQWIWKIVFKTPFFRQTKTGSFLASEADEQGFVKIHSQNPYRFIFQNGDLFTPVGLQDCFKDLNHNGNPLDQWAIGLDEKPNKNQKVISFSDFKTYLHIYGPNGAGFNLFRWNIDNCSNKLWREIVPGKNHYRVNQGIFGDQLVKVLKQEGFRIWMAIFGFEAPLMDAIQDKDSQKAIKKYVDYVVARYSVYVDIWELSNEISPSEEWINFVAEYLRSADPYNHPITINWQRPELEAIEINSLHWYEREFIHESDLVTANKISQAKKWGKPVIFSEQGNVKSNWDEDSSLRMRLRLWTAFFEEASMIFWNTSQGLYEDEEKPTNIYLGPKERRYVRVLQDFSQGIDGEIKKEKIELKDDKVIRGYALKSPQCFLLYLYHGENHQQSIKSSIDLNLFQEGVLTWINPENGKILEQRKINSGEQRLTTPWFKIDLALKIRFED